MKLFVNTVLPYNNEITNLLLEKKKIQKYLKPNCYMRLKKLIRKKLNPYSNYRQKYKIGKVETYYLKKINLTLNNKFIKYKC